MLKIPYNERMKSLDNIDEFTELYKIPCAEGVIDFINRFCFTYNPRLKKDKIVPFELFPKQEEFIHWLWDRYDNGKAGVVDKSRDVGATWLVVAFMVHQMMFTQDFSGGIYTLVADLCDKKGDRSTIFEKIRVIIDYLPKQWTYGIVDNYMHISNTLTGSDIAGSSGANPGRGGRRSMYLKDESAFYQNEEMVEAAISETSDCIIDVSTHKGTNTLFYRTIQAMPENVFVFNWYDNLLHTQAWFDKKKDDAERKGTMHIFAREILRDARASVENVMIPASWVGAVTITGKIDRGQVVSSLDVADEGLDTNGQIIRKGNHILFIDEWNEIDVGVTTDRAYRNALKYKVNEFRYDNIGIGSGVKARLNRIELDRFDAGEGEHPFECIGWNAGGAVQRPTDEDFNETPNRDLFSNAKAQAWWKIRDEFYNIFRKLEKKSYEDEKILTFSDKIDKIILNKLFNEISQPTMKLNEKGLISVDKKPKGTKSPNLADSLVINRAEVAKAYEYFSF